MKYNYRDTEFCLFIYSGAILHTFLLSLTNGVLMMIMNGL